MKTICTLTLLALAASSAPAFSQGYYGPHHGHRYWQAPRTLDGRIPGRREAHPTPWGYNVNGNANGNNLTRSNGS